MDAALPLRLDFFRLALNLGGNRAVIVQMLDMFLASTTQQLLKMEAAERALNVLAWLQIAHQLKGAAQNITAKRMAGLCIEAEEIAHLPHPQSSSVIYHLHKELALLRDAVDAFKRAGR